MALDVRYPLCALLALLGVAQALRAGIKAGAGVSAGQGAAPSKPGAVVGERTDSGGASAPRGGP
jgi:hypothetical protein